MFELLEAAARSDEPWPLWLMGTGPAENAIAARVPGRLAAARFATSHRWEHAFAARARRDLEAL